MKNTIAVLLFALAFSVNAGAQTKETKKDKCCSAQTTCAGKTASADAAHPAACTESKTAHVCKTDGSCCAGKTPPKKA